MKKAFISLLCIFFVFSFSFAGEISQSKAIKIAQQFYSNRSSNAGIQKITANNLTLNYIKKYKPVSGDSISAFYVFNKGNSGFVIISANDQTKQILGYSDESSFDLVNCPENLQYWLDNYSSEISSVTNTESTDATTFTIPVETNSTKQSASLALSVPPLLGGTKWNQGSPYNNLCPAIDSDGTKGYTGCVATAMAQVMKYHEWPVSGTGSNSYTTRTLNIPLSLDFSETTFDWANMTDTYSSTSTNTEKDAVAALMYNCGIAVDMDYKTTSSGAYSREIGKALINNFGYDSNIQEYSRDYYTREEWSYLIQTEIDASRPVIYSGHTLTSGHEFVLDGYDSNGLFHINWGWGGLSNGYFEISALNPDVQGIGGSTGGFDCYQAATIGIQKPNSSTTPTYLLYEYNSAPTTTSTSVNKNQSFTVTTEKVYNLGINTFNGSIGLGIYQNNSLKQVTGTTTVSNLQSYSGWNTLNLNASINSSLASGNYKLYLIYKANSETDWQIMRGLVGNPNYINLTVNSSNINIDVPTTTGPVLTLDSIAVTGNLYQTKTGRVTIKVTNTGEEYNSILGVALTSKADNSVYQFIYTPINVTHNETRIIDLSDSIGLEPGEYYVSAMYDPTNNFYTVSDVSALGNPLVKNILTEPTEGPNLTLTEAISFPDNNAVNKNNVVLSAPLKNTSGFFDNKIIAFIFNASGGSSISYLGYQDAIFDTNEERTVTFSGSLDLDNGDYLVAVYYYDETNGWSRITPKDYSYLEFTLVDDVTNVLNVTDNKLNIYPNPASDILNINTQQNMSKIKITDLSGRTLVYKNVSGTTTQVSVSTLNKGVYILNVETQNGNYTEKFIKK
ncbi:MAG: thiol protease/hemagglutinin PrtT [Paludibacter sp.]|nr:thiol protease/hemagglutinin PrtT [Paludibacter sp.]